MVIVRPIKSCGAGIINNALFLLLSIKRNHEEGQKLLVEKINGKYGFDLKKISSQN